MHLAVKLTNFFLPVIIFSQAFLGPDKRTENLTIFSLRTEKIFLENAMHLAVKLTNFFLPVIIFSQAFLGPGKRTENLTISCK